MFKWCVIIVIKFYDQKNIWHLVVGFFNWKIRKETWQKNLLHMFTKMLKLQPNVVIIETRLKKYFQDNTT